MDFGWSPAQKHTYDAMLALGAEAEAAHPDERLTVLARGGALGLCLPADFGGGGLDYTTTVYGYEALGYGLSDGGSLLAAGAHLFGVGCAIAKAGSAEQRARFLPGLASGQTLGTVAATEAGSGSNVAEIEALAQTIDGRTLVSGDKCYVTMGDRAALFLVVARASKDKRQLTTLLVPRSNATRPGPLLETAGLRGARLGAVSFEEAEADSVLGREGAGLAVFQMAMTFERAMVLAFRVGALARSLDRAIAFARSRSLGGARIADHEAVSHRIARMRLRLETARLITYRAAWELDQGKRAQLEAALAKWHVADAALASAVDDITLRGGAGFLEPSGLPSALDDAIGGTIHSGTSDVQATIVARLLGL